MEAVAIARYLRTSLKKMKRVIDLVKGLTVSDAQAILMAIPNKQARMLAKVIKSAAANYANKQSKRLKDINMESLVIKELQIGRGPFLRRIYPRARGRADIIKRPTIHVSVVVSDEIKPVKKVK